MADNCRSIDVLLELTESLRAGVGLDRALDQVARAALALLPCEHASVRIFDDSRSELLCGARAGEGTSSRPMAFRRGEGVIGWVAQHGEPARIEDAAADARFKRGADQGFTIGSILAVPLLSGGQVVGVLGATSSARAAFSAEDETLALLLANCVSPALDVARLERLATTDPGTLAFKEPHLLPRLSSEIDNARREQRPVSLVAIAPDWPSGQAAGDDKAIEEVLRGVSETARAFLCNRDVLVRRGGDQLLLVLPETDAEGAGRVAERIRSAVSHGGLRGGRGPRGPTVSAGVATWDDREEPEQLVERVLSALGEASGGGGNRVVTRSAEDGAEPAAST